MSLSEIALQEEHSRESACAVTMASAGVVEKPSGTVALRYGTLGEGLRSFIWIGTPGRAS
jgi:hypothetical protein